LTLPAIAFALHYLQVFSTVIIMLHSLHCISHSVRCLQRTDMTC
jgi:hypothetical protein